MDDYTKYHSDYLKDFNKDNIIFSIQEGLDREDNGVRISDNLEVNDNFSKVFYDEIIDASSQHSKDLCDHLYNHRLAFKNGEFYIKMKCFNEKDKKALNEKYPAADDNSKYLNFDIKKFKIDDNKAKNKRKEIFDDVQSNIDYQIKDMLSYNRYYNFFIHLREFTENNFDTNSLEDYVLSKTDILYTQYYQQPTEDFIDFLKGNELVFTDENTFGISQTKKNRSCLVDIQTKFSFFKNIIQDINKDRETFKTLLEISRDRKTHNIKFIDASLNNLFKKEDNSLNENIKNLLYFKNNLNNNQMVQGMSQLFKSIKDIEDKCDKELKEKLKGITKHLELLNFIETKTRFIETDNELNKNYFYPFLPILKNYKNNISLNYVDKSYEVIDNNNLGLVNYDNNKIVELNFNTPNFTDEIKDKGSLIRYLRRNIEEFIFNFQLFMGTDSGYDFFIHYFMSDRYIMNKINEYKEFNEIYEYLERSKAYLDLFLFNTPIINKDFLIVTDETDYTYKREKQINKYKHFIYALKNICINNKDVELTTSFNKFLDNFWENNTIDIEINKIRNNFKNTEPYEDFISIAKLFQLYLEDTSKDKYVEIIKYYFDQFKDKISKITDKNTLKLCNNIDLILTQVDLTQDKKTLCGDIFFTSLNIVNSLYTKADKEYLDGTKLFESIELGRDVKIYFIDFINKMKIYFNDKKSSVSLILKNLYEILNENIEITEVFNNKDLYVLRNDTLYMKTDNYLKDNFIIINDDIKIKLKDIIDEKYKFIENINMKKTYYLNNVITNYELQKKIDVCNDINLNVKLFEYIPGFVFNDDFKNYFFILYNFTNYFLTNKTFYNEIDEPSYYCHLLKILQNIDIMKNKLNSINTAAGVNPKLDDKYIIDYEDEIESFIIDNLMDLKKKENIYTDYINTQKSFQDDFVLQTKTFMEKLFPDLKIFLTNASNKNIFLNSDVLKLIESIYNPGNNDLFSQVNVANIQSESTIAGVPQVQNQTQSQITDEQIKKALYRSLEIISRKYKTANFKVLTFMDFSNNEKNDVFSYVEGNKTKPVVGTKYDFAIEHSKKWIIQLSNNAKNTLFDKAIFRMKTSKGSKSFEIKTVEDKKVKNYMKNFIKYLSGIKDPNIKVLSDNFSDSDLTNKMKEIGLEQKKDITDFFNKLSGDDKIKTFVYSLIYLTISDSTGDTVQEVDDFWTNLPSAPVQTVTVQSQQNNNQSISSITKIKNKLKEILYEIKDNDLKDYLNNLIDILDNFIKVYTFFNQNLPLLNQIGLEEYMIKSKKDLSLIKMIKDETYNDIVQANYLDQATYTNKLSFVMTKFKEKFENYVIQNNYYKDFFNEFNKDDKFYAFCYFIKNINISFLNDSRSNTKLLVGENLDFDFNNKKKEDIEQSKNDIINAPNFNTLIKFDKLIAKYKIFSYDALIDIIIELNEYEYKDGNNTNKFNLYKNFILETDGIVELKNILNKFYNQELLKNSGLDDKETNDLLNMIQDKTVTINEKTPINIPNLKENDYANKIRINLNRPDLTTKEKYEDYLNFSLNIFIDKEYYLNYIKWFGDRDNIEDLNRLFVDNDYNGRCTVVYKIYCKELIFYPQKDYMDIMNPFFEIFNWQPINILEKTVELNNKKDLTKDIIPKNLDYKFLSLVIKNLISILKKYEETNIYYFFFILEYFFEKIKTNEIKQLNTKEYVQTIITDIISKLFNQNASVFKQANEVNQIKKQFFYLEDDYSYYLKEQVDKDNNPVDILKDNDYHLNVFKKLEKDNFKNYSRIVNCFNENDGSFLINLFRRIYKKELYNFFDFEKKVNYKENKNLFDFNLECVPIKKKSIFSSSEYLESNIPYQYKHELLEDKLYVYPSKIVSFAEEVKKSKGLKQYDKLTEDEIKDSYIRCMAYLSKHKDKVKIFSKFEKQLSKKDINFIFKKDLKEKHLENGININNLENIIIKREDEYFIVKSKNLFDEFSFNLFEVLSFCLIYDEKDYYEKTEEYFIPPIPSLKLYYYFINFLTKD
jgi:hypothetical protein